MSDDPTVESPVVTVPVKRGRGRPRKHPFLADVDENVPKPAELLTEAETTLPVLADDGLAQDMPGDTRTFRETPLFNSFWAKYTRKWNPYQVQVAVMVSEHCTKGDVEKFLADMKALKHQDAAQIALAGGRFFYTLQYQTRRTPDQDRFVAFWRRHLPDLIDVAILSAEWRAKKRQEIVEDCIARRKYGVALAALRDMDEWQRTNAPRAALIHSERYEQTTQLRQDGQQQWFATLTANIQAAMMAGPTPPGGFRPNPQDDANADAIQTK